MLRNMSKKMGSALRMLAMLRLIPRRGKIDSAREYQLQGFDLQTYLGRDAFQYPKPEDALIELVLRVHRDTAVHLGEPP